MSPEVKVVAGIGLFIAIVWVVQMALFLFGLWWDCYRKGVDKSDDL